MGDIDLPLLASADSQGHRRLGIPRRQTERMLSCRPPFARRLTGELEQTLHWVRRPPTTGMLFSTFLGGSNWDSGMASRSIRRRNLRHWRNSVEPISRSPTCIR